MLAVKERIQTVNQIGKMVIVSHNNQHHILTEWSRQPIESFNDYLDAQEFVDGFYLKEATPTPAYQKGSLLRKFVEVDLKEGVQYNIVTDLSSYI